MAETGDSTPPHSEGSHDSSTSSEIRPNFPIQRKIVGYHEVSEGRMTGPDTANPRNADAVLEQPNFDVEQGIMDNFSKLLAQDSMGSLGEKVVVAVHKKTRDPKSTLHISPAVDTANLARLRNDTKVLQMLNGFLSFPEKNTFLRDKDALTKLRKEMMPGKRLQGAIDRFYKAYGPGYEQAMNDFMTSLFGPAQEYWDQIRLMKTQSTSKSHGPSSTDGASSAPPNEGSTRKKPDSSQEATRLRKRVEELEADKIRLQKENDRLRMSGRSADYRTEDPQGYYEALGTTRSFIASLSDSELRTWLKRTKTTLNSMFHPDANGGGNGNLSRVQKANAAIDAITKERRLR